MAAPEDAATAAQYAHELFKANKRKLAKEIAEKVRETDTKNANAALVVAKLALRSEDAEEAMSVLMEGLDRDKPNLEIVELLAAMKLKAADAAAAAELYELGLKSRPRSKDFLKGLAAAAAKNGDRAKLKVSLEQLVDLDPDESLYPKKLADLALEDEAWEDALRYAKATLYVDVMDPQTHVLLAKAYAGLSRTDKALEEWKVAAELKPDEVDYAVGLARAEAAAGQKDEARTRLEAVLKKEPEHAEARKALDELR